ncbi:MAG: class I SAM-dependent methyltransferase [Myxococcota bacterium]
MSRSSTLTDTHVRDFYASGGGDRMFSRAHATPAILDYLEREERYVKEVFRQLSPRHLFEVGCGTGSYLDWAERHRVDYDGVDLVSHLVEAGRKRLTGSARTRQKLHVGSCREVAALFDAEGLKERARDVVVLFPFNCFGNVAEPARVVHSLKHAGARVLVSGFVPTDEATGVRREYYLKNGFTRLTDTRDELGVLFTSAEGLHSWALEPAVLERLFSREGFRLAHAEALGPVARAALFEAKT